MADRSYVLDFGVRLKELRTKRQLTQSQVAEMLGVRRATISGYESNTAAPSLEKVAQLALIYHTTTDHIIGLDHRKTIILEGFTDNEAAALSNMIDSLINEIKTLRFKK